MATNFLALSIAVWRSLRARFWYFSDQKATYLTSTSTLRFLPSGPSTATVLWPCLLLTLVGDAALPVAGAGVAGLREHPGPQLGVGPRAAYGLRVHEAVPSRDQRRDVGGAVVALIADGDDALTPVVALHALEDIERRAGVGGVAGKEPVADRDSAGVLEKAHLHDGALAVLLGRALLPQAARLVDLEVVVGDVVEHAGGVANPHLVHRAVDRGDDTVPAGADGVEGAVGVVERELRPEEVPVPVLPGALLGPWVQEALDGEQPHHRVGIVVGAAAPGGVADGGLDAQGVVGGHPQRRADVLPCHRALVDPLLRVDLDGDGLGLGLPGGGALLADLLEVRDGVRPVLVHQVVNVAQGLDGPVLDLAALAVALDDREVGPSLALRLAQIHPLTWPLAGFIDTRLYHRQQQTATGKDNQT